MLEFLKVFMLLCALSLISLLYCLLYAHIYLKSQPQKKLAIPGIVLTTALTSYLQAILADSFENVGLLWEFISFLGINALTIFLGVNLLKQVYKHLKDSEASQPKEDQ